MRVPTCNSFKTHHTRQNLCYLSARWRCYRYAPHRVIKLQSVSLLGCKLSWERVTAKLVDISAIPFILLLLPQLFKNAVALKSGNATSLEGLAWMGFLTALIGNTQLTGYFLDKREQSAAAIQGIGALSNYGILLQVAVAGYLPFPLPVALIVSFWLSVTVFTARAAGCLCDSSKPWLLWQAAMAIIGLVTVPQVLWHTFTGSNSLVPMVLSSVPAVALVVMEIFGVTSGYVKHLWVTVSAWTATVLFCCQPVAQLTANFSNPQAVLSLSFGTLVFATVGNAMMVPRALYARDPVWLTGSVWGSVAMGLGNLFSMALANTRYGIGYFTATQFAIATTMMLVYFSFIVLLDRSSKNESTQLQAGVELA